MGTWGYGRIGKRIAQYAKAFERTVVIWWGENSRCLALDHSFEVYPSKQAFFKDSDIVSIHLRLSEETKACVTAEDLKAMKVDSLFVNISRSELVEKRALYDELTSVPSKCAAIDVFDIVVANKNLPQVRAFHTFGNLKDLD